MKKRLRFVTIPALFMITLALNISCQEDQLDDSDYTDPSAELLSSSKKNTSSTAISVDWNNWTNGDQYNVAMAISDFGDIHNFTRDEQARTLISLSRLRVTLVKEEYGASGGVITNSSIENSEGYEINYRVKFHSAFDFKSKAVLGWGLNIGDGAAKVDDGQGASFRLMWDKDSQGNFYFKPYIYHADQPGVSGDDFGVRYPAVGNSLTGSVWYDVKMVFKANTKMNKNGSAKLYINEVEVLNVPIRWTKDHSKRYANQLLFSNYRSGAGSQSTRVANIWFDDFTLQGNTPSYDPSWCDGLYTRQDRYDAISNTYYHLVTIDNTSDFKLKSGISADTNGETGTDFAKRMDCCIAFNASMGISNPPPGERHPVGIQIVDGAIVQDRTNIRYELGIKDNNALRSYPKDETATNIKNDGAHYALTAFTPLIENGQTVSQSVLNSVANYSVKHPRQVVAQYPGGDILIFSCGGRGFQGDGMFANDVIRILTELGVDFAFMLDGGGSVTTVVNGERITPMIDGNGTMERPRPNWLYIENH